MTAMAKYCITRLLAENSLDMPSFLAETFFQPYMTALRNLHDIFVRTFGITNRPIPIAHLLEGERSIYHVLLEFSRDKPGRQRKIAEYMLGSTVFDVADMEDRLFSRLSEMSLSGGVRPGEVLIDVPAKDRSKPSGERGGSVLVYAGNEYGRGRPIEKVTPIIQTLVKLHESRSKVCRVFVSRRVEKALGTDGWKRLSAIVVDILEDETRNSPPLAQILAEK